MRPNRMTFASLIKTATGKSWLVFSLVFAWEVALLVFTAQPVPANDSFFYDGPVVNYLLNGRYANPSLALVLPISGTEVFSAYPPLYQCALFFWMSAFGTAAMSAMVFHLVLFGLYLLLLLAILRRLGVPAWCINVAGVFLLILTFHDRPDSLAHVLGMLAVYAWVRSSRFLAVRENTAPASWRWLTAGSVVLCLCTSLQIGLVYFFLLWVGVSAGTVLRGEPFPLAPMAVVTLVPAALVALVFFGFPHLWAGFLEHARLTPSFTGLRVPTVGDLLKIGRTVPGVLAAALLLLWSVATGKRFFPDTAGRYWIVAAVGALAAVGVVAACLFFWAANMVSIAAYLQPLLVGCFLAGMGAVVTERSRVQRLAALFLALAALGSIRAVGMTTWGVACAADVSRAAALARVRAELETVPRGSIVAASSAFLYEAARHKEIVWIHSDWPGKTESGQPAPEWQALLALKPAKLILTQFDYYRHYDSALARLKAHPELVEFRVVNTARVPAPDSIRSLQRVVQHVSWAPVIVCFAWKQR